MGITRSISRFEEMIEDHSHKTQILAEGDSWFAIPTAKNIIKQINKIGQFNILNLASSGDEAMGMMTWKQKKKIHKLLLDEDNEYSFKVLLFSGGGNDIVGPEMWHLFNDYQAGMTVEQCFNDDMLDIKLTQIECVYRELINIRDNLKPGLPIVTHCYDRAKPSGKAAYLGPIKVSGPWMKPSLKKRKIPTNLHQDIVDHLLGKLRKKLLGLQDKYTDFYVVDSFCVISANQWGDELHPKSSGFKRIVNEKWKPLFEQLGIS
jgi:hypothetical protein